MLGASCPTFSWTATPTAEGYEIVVYRVDTGGDIEPKVRTQVPAGASSWTPAAGECPESGDRFAWSVRATTIAGTGPWSEALLFATPGVPSDDELREALGALERYRTHHTEGDDPSEPTAEPGSTACPTDAFGPAVAENPNPKEGTAEREVLTAPSLGVNPPPAVVTPADPGFSLDSDLALGGFVFKDGVPFIHNDGGAIYGSTAVGLNALVSSTLGGPYDGVQNTAFGYEALRYNASGYVNTAVGNGALKNNSFGSGNTALGKDALGANTGGFRNTAVGEQALQLNTNGSFNTAVGENALLRNSGGFFNTAIGHAALENLTTGTYNTALGFGALRMVTASSNSNNTAIGTLALYSVGVGSSNTAVGSNALTSTTSGNLNTGVGPGAGIGWTTGDYNIALGHGAVGVAGESGTIRIGGGDLQVATYIEGISGATAAGGRQVFVNSDDKLGILTSSRRFKREIEDLEVATEQLLELRPVRFRYKGDSEDRGDVPIEFGLIAEEVAETFPELVVWDDAGRPYSVRYHLLAPLLLEEIQKQRIELEQLRSRADEAAIRERDYEVELSDLRRRSERWTRKGRGR